MDTFIVYRGSWRSGGYGKSAVGTGPGLLLNSDQCMCCLGQVMVQADESLLKRLLGVGTPEYVFVEFIHVPSQLRFLFGEPRANGFTKHSSLAGRAMTLNDNSLLTVAEREQKLIALFKAEGYTLEFVDGVAPWFQKAQVCELA